MNIIKSSILILISISLSLPAVALPTNKELKIGIAQEFETLNPLVMSMAASSFMFYLVGRTLITINAEGKWTPKLAKEIPSLENKLAKFVEENGKKKIIATWEIVEKATWGDGKPVICEDFITAHKIATSNTVSTPEKEAWTQVAKIDVDPQNPKKCYFTYEKAKWDFYQLAQFYPVPTHLEKAIFEKYGKQNEGYEKNSNYVRNPTMPGLYCGPYIVSDVKLGSHITFVPNKYFYGSAPKIQKLVVKVIPNTGTLEANLRSGTIDMISILGLDLDQAQAFEKKIRAENLPFVVNFEPSITFEHIDLNMDNPILSDARVRKALLHAMNREDLVKALFNGKQEAAIHSFSPKDSWFTRDPKYVTFYTYSKHRAKKLLEEAGWKKGPDGIREKDGQRLSLNFQTTAGNKVRELVQVYLQNQWRQIGVEILIKNEPARVFFGNTINHRKFSGLAMYAWMSSPENNPRSSFHSKSIPSEKNSWSGQNAMGWRNAIADKAMEDLDLEFSAEKRAELAKIIIQQYTTDIPSLPLYYRSDNSVTPKNLRHYKITGHQFYETNNAEDWTLE